MARCVLKYVRGKATLTKFILSFACGQNHHSNVSFNLIEDIVPPNCIHFHVVIVVFRT